MAVAAPGASINPVRDDFFLAEKARYYRRLPGGKKSRCRRCRRPFRPYVWDYQECRTLCLNCYLGRRKEED